MNLIDILKELIWNHHLRERLNTINELDVPDGTQIMTINFYRDFGSDSGARVETVDTCSELTVKMINFLITSLAFTNDVHMREQLDAYVDKDLAGKSDAEILEHINSAR